MSAILVMIENRVLLSKIVSIFDKTNIKYTTNKESNYKYLLVAELNQRIVKLINEMTEKNKKVIFLAFLEEYKIQKYYNSNSVKANEYKQLLFSILNKCHLVITSLPFFKDYLEKQINTKVIVIEKANPRLPDLKKTKPIQNTCLIIDYDYTEIINVFDMAIKYPKIKFQVLGYRPEHMLSQKQIGIIKNLPENVELIKYCDFVDFLSLIKRNSIIVYCDDDNRNYHYLLYIILNRKKLLIKNSVIYDNYFINSKNMYLYKDSKEFNLRLKKIINGTVANLSNEAFLLIKDNRLEKMGKQLKKIIK